MQSADYHPLSVSNPFGGPVLWTEATGSTMADARALLRRDHRQSSAAGPGESGETAGLPPTLGRPTGAAAATGAPEPEAAPREPGGPPAPGTILVAGYQSSGRGQGPGRAWTAPPGSSLMFTLCLPGAQTSPPLEALPLRIAVGMSRFLSKAGYHGIHVKWPNDVLVSEKKICGILCHHVADWFLVGVGLNVNQRSFPADLRRPATSLVLEGAPGIDVLSLLEPLLQELSRALSTTGWRERLEPLLLGIGEEVELWGPSREARAPGTVVGIDESGALLVQLKKTGEIEAIYSRDRLEWRKKI